MSQNSDFDTCRTSSGESSSKLSANNFATTISGVIYATNVHIGAGNNTANVPPLDTGRFC